MSRAFMCGFLSIIVAGALCGCNGMGAKSGAPATSQSVAANTTRWSMKSGAANVLTLTSPADFKCASSDGMLHFTSTQPYEVEFWLVNGAHTVDEATGLASTQIVSEFKDFKPEHTTDLTVAGSAAKRLVGSGHEADDGDPGDADLIIFNLGEHVFIACTHGESLNPVAQQGMLTLVQSAQMP